MLKIEKKNNRTDEMGLVRHMNRIFYVRILIHISHTLFFGSNWQLTSRWQAIVFTTLWADSLSHLCDTSAWYGNWMKYISLEALISQQRTRDGLSDCKIS